MEACASCGRAVPVSGDRSVMTHERSTLQTPQGPNLLAKTKNSKSAPFLPVLVGRRVVLAMMCLQTLTIKIQNSLVFVLCFL